MAENTPTHNPLHNVLPEKKGSEMHDEEFRDYLVATLAAVDVKITDLYGNGRKGRVKELEEKVNKLMFSVVLIGLLAIGSNPKAEALLGAAIKFMIG